MHERGRMKCGCIPGEICCEAATEASRRLRDELQLSMTSGDWTRFDRVRAWLQEHHFGRVSMTGTDDAG